PTPHLGPHLSAWDTCTACPPPRSPVIVSPAEPCDMRRRCATCCSERRSPSRVNDSSPGVVGRPLPPTSRWVWGLLPGQPDSYAATRHFSDSPPQPRCFG